VIAALTVPAAVIALVGLANLPTTANKLADSGTCLPELDQCASSGAGPLAVCDVEGDKGVEGNHKGGNSAAPAK
jgi:hypothetical protein